ncbi:hypothetical protein FF100_29310 [Methylobacterium terricola]|uniref:Uncharacterized protein n=1 Tax=Methylobacterium terricola TaxID=2583531 RepID=A0A5C4L8D8_9HYPH|nr:hypothetical protein [Methylobacterium terricola]TNC08440.1 hypothetical protein FF100_29310 [Methylobacterium terricola]
MRIERRAELCPQPFGLQPCRACGSTAAVIELRPGAVRLRRLCCHGDPLALPEAGNGAVEVRRHG